MLVFSTLSVFSLIIGLIWCKREENKHISRLVIWTFVMMYLLIYFSGRFYSYYPLIFGVFVPFGLIALADIYERNVKIRFLQRYDLNMNTALSLALCVLGMFFFRKSDAYELWVPGYGGGYDRRYFAEPALFLRI